MRGTLILTLASVAVAADALAQTPRRRGNRSRSASSVELKNFTVKRMEFEAKSFDRGGYIAYLPVGYDDKASRKKLYPLAVWLHGMNEDANRFHSRGGAEAIDAMRGKGDIPAMIVVAASASRRTFYLNGESGGDMEDYIRKDLLGHVEANFRVAKDPKQRAILGVSAGGMGALKIAFKYPADWGAVVSHSGAILHDDPDSLPERYRRASQRYVRSFGLDQIFGDPIDKKRWAAEMPMGIARHSDVAKLDGLAIYFDAGTADRYGFAAPNSQLHELMKKRGIEHSFELVQGGGHSWGSGSIQKQLLKSFAFVAKAFAGDVDKVEKGETERDRVDK